MMSAEASLLLHGVFYYPFGQKSQHRRADWHTVMGGKK
jgi:hypothetical protein